MNDTRLDQLIRSSLEWHSTGVASAQPPLRQASSRLAGRVGHSLAQRPRVTMTPASAGGLNLLMIILLLVALAAAAVFVGSLLLRTTAPPFLPRPGLFGHATDCQVALRAGVVFELGVESFGPGASGEDRNYTLWEDGTLLLNRMVSAPTRRAQINQSYNPRVLTTEGVAAVRDRIAQAGLTPGCRSVRSDTMGGRISALTDAGYVEVFWGPNVSSRPLGRHLGPEEESALAALVGDLEHSATWLDDEMWVYATPQVVRPEHWLLGVGVRQTEHQPGDRVVLINGTTLVGTDPRYEQVLLPGGQQLLEFGLPVAIGNYNPTGLMEQRCGVLTRDEAVAVAASLDGLSLGTDGDGDLLTPDLTLELTVSLLPRFPDIYDCAARAATLARLGAPLPDSEPVGEFAEVDPCTLIPQGSAAAILGTSGQATLPSRLPLGLSADACVLFDGQLSADDPFNDPYYATAMVTIYPQLVSREIATEIAQDLFGAGIDEQTIDGITVWANECHARRLDCQSAAAAWTGEQLVIFEFTEQYRRSMSMNDPLERRISHEAARAFVAAIVGSLARR